MCSVDELRKLLAEKESYNAFFNSLDQVKIQNNVSVHSPLRFSSAPSMSHYHAYIFFMNITLLLRFYLITFSSRANYRKNSHNLSEFIIVNLILLSFIVSLNSVFFNPFLTFNLLLEADDACN